MMAEPETKNQHIASSGMKGPLLREGGQAGSSVENKHQQVDEKAH